MTSQPLRNRIDSSVISIGWKLYRQNWKQYVLISLRGYLWMLVPTLAIAGAIGSLGVQTSEETYANNLGDAVGLFVLAGVVFLAASALLYFKLMLIPSRAMLTLE